MPDYTYQQLAIALRNADAAGDVEAATKLAGAIKAMQGQASAFNGVAGETKGPRFNGIPIASDGDAAGNAETGTIPPLPAGFQLEGAGGANLSMPPLPPGFQLETPQVNSEASRGPRYLPQDAAPGKRPPRDLLAGRPPRDLLADNQDGSPGPYQTKGPRFQGIAVEALDGPSAQDAQGDKVPLNIEGQRVYVDRDFLNLSSDEQNKAVDEIAQSLGPQGRPGMEMERKRALALAEARRATEQDNTDALSKVRTASGGFLEGIPVVGPLIRGGVERAAAATIAPFSDKDYSQVLSEIQQMSADEKAANPKLDTGSQIAGAVAGTVPMVMAAPEVFGARGGSLLNRIVASAASGGAIGGMDSAVRSDGDIGSILSGMGAGVVTGAIAPALGKAIGAGWQGLRNFRAGRAAADAAGLNKSALFTLGRAIRDDGLDANTVGQRMNELGPSAMLMDAGPNLQRQAGALAATPGRGQEMVRSAIAARQAGSGDRITQALNNVLDRPVDTHSVASNWTKIRADAARPAYEAAYEAGDKAIWSPELERLSASPTVQRAMRGAVTTWQDRAIADGFGAMNPGASVERGGSLKFLGGKIPAFPNIQFWDYTKRIIDDAARSAFRNGQNQKGATLSKLTEMLRTDLDKSVPEYAAARDAYAGPSAIIDALEEGQSAFSSAKTPGELRARLQEMTSGEREAYLQGARGQIAHIMGTARNDALAARNMFQKGFNREKLELLAGPDQASQLLRTLESETAFTRTRDIVTGNSETAARSAAMREIAGDNGQQFGLREGYMSGGLFGGARSAGVRVAEKIVSALSSASREARNAGLADAISRSNYGDIVEALSKSQGKKVNGQSIDLIARALLTGGGISATRP